MGTQPPPQSHKNTTLRKHFHDNHTQPHNNHSTMHNHMTTQTTTHDHIQPPQQPHHHSHNIHLDHIIHQPTQLQRPTTSTSTTSPPRLLLFFQSVRVRGHVYGPKKKKRKIPV